MRHKLYSLRRAAVDPSARGISVLLLVMLFSGVAVGAVVGSFSSPEVLEGYAVSRLLPSGFPAALWQAFRYFLVLLLSAGSLYGIAALPALLFVRGYVLSCSVSALYALFSFRGLGRALALCLVPALLTVPCCYAAGCDAFRCSLELLRFRLGRSGLLPFRGMVRHIPAILLLTVLDACYCYYLLPPLLAK